MVMISKVIVSMTRDITFKKIFENKKMKTWICILLLFLMLGCGIESRKVDKWDEISNWTATQEIDGIECKLYMVRRTPISVEEVDSASDIKKDEGCSAYYYYMKDNKRVHHGPAYQWKTNGEIEQRSMNLHGRLLELFRYYPSGEVINSIKYDESSNLLTTSWFSKSGLELGKYIVHNKSVQFMRPEDNNYYWNGKTISAEKYMENIRPLMIESSK